MPPRKPAKRARRAPAATTPSTSKSTSKPAPFSSVTGVNATTNLPAELYLEIASYFRSVPIHETTGGGYHLETHLHALERQDALRAMSQTCRAWRSFFRPLLWENVEMAGTRTGGGQWYIQCSKTLMEKCTEIKECEEVAGWVRGLRVVLSTREMGSCLELLREAMKACTFLKTVHVYFAQTDSAKMINEAFDKQKCVFKSVEKVIIPAQAHGILRCCPNVKEVVCTQGVGSQVISAMQTKCKKVEVVEGIRPDMGMVKRLVKAGTNIRELRFNPANKIPSIPILEQLGPLKNLRAITLTCAYNLEEKNVEAHFVHHMAALRKVVKNCTVTMKPVKRNGWHCENPVADPGCEYEHKVYIK